MVYNLSLQAVGFAPEGPCTVDGLTLGYRNGQYAITLVSCLENKEQIPLEITSVTGQYPLPGRNYDLLFHIKEKPAAVSINDREIPESSAGHNEGAWTFERKKGILYLTFRKMPDETSRIDIHRQ